MRIAIVTPGARFTKGYVQSLFKLMGLKGVRLGLVSGYSADIYQIRNKLAHDVVEKADYDVMLWIDSDMVFEPEDVMRVCSRPEPIVSGLCLVDEIQINAAVFREEGILSYLNGHRLDETGLIQEDGALPVDMVGFGFLAFKAGVFESVDKPWFRTGNVTGPDGNAYGASEDMGFTWRCSQAGHQIVVDTGASIGHEKTRILKI